MSKILSVGLREFPKHINVGDDINDITVIVAIKFHELDLKLKMPYSLHVYVYDIHGELDAPLIIPNWDDCEVIPISSGRKDDFLGKKVIMIEAVKEEVTVECPMALKLGKIHREMSPTQRKIEVFATMAPIVGRASKYSEMFISNISY